LTNCNWLVICPHIRNWSISCLKLKPYILKFHCKHCFDKSNYRVSSHVRLGRTLWYLAQIPVTLIIFTISSFYNLTFFFLQSRFHRFVLEIGAWREHMTMCDTHFRRRVDAFQNGLEFRNIVIDWHGGR